MKKVNLKGKLNLGKEAVTMLNNSAMNQIAGGLFTQGTACPQIPCNTLKVCQQASKQLCATNLSFCC
jgi:hypothetical protein